MIGKKRSRLAASDIGPSSLSACFVASEKSGTLRKPKSLSAMYGAIDRTSARSVTVTPMVLGMPNLPYTLCFGLIPGSYPNWPPMPRHSNGRMPDVPRAQAVGPRPFIPVAGRSGRRGVPPRSHSPTALCRSDQICLAWASEPGCGTVCANQNALVARFPTVASTAPSRNDGAAFATWLADGERTVS